MGRVDGRIAIVAGAGSSGPGWGNGKAIAVLLAREGARVLALDVNAASLEETIALIEGEEGLVLGVQADITVPEDCQRAAEYAVEQWGHIDVLINNVGILEVGGAVDLPTATWERVLRVNLTGFYLMTRAVLPNMLESGGGSIVNIGSVAGLRYLGVPYISYAASKAGILGLTQSTALEFASRGVRVNTVLPGLMDTPMIIEPLKEVYGRGDIERMKNMRDAQCPMGHMGNAWDVAYATLFLASDEAKYITGTQLIVDGGLTAKC
jgi:NAD(P)-dependent dehydrogenase (short-subunit alcohol dehydrogenase family)